MARFHIHRVRNREGLVLERQADLLAELATRVVAPLVPVGEVGQLFARLSLNVELSGRRYAVLFPAMAAMPKSMLGPSVADLSARHDEIVAATDFLFQGF